MSNQLTEEEAKRISTEIFTVMESRISRGAPKTYVKVSLPGLRAITAIDKNLVVKTTEYNLKEVANDHTDKLLSVTDEGLTPFGRMRKCKVRFGVNVVRIYSEDTIKRIFKDQLSFYEAEFRDCPDLAYSACCGIKDPDGLHINRDTVTRVHKENPELVNGSIVHIELHHSDPKKLGNYTEIVSTPNKRQ